MSELKIGGSHLASDWLTDSARSLNHQHSLNRYFGINGETEIFQGRNFEWFLSKSQNGMFTPFDFLAIGSLSVEIPAESQRLLLEDAGSKYKDLLGACREYVNSNQASEDLSWIWKTGNPLELLYSELRSVRGIGPVVCSKLMAAKFPAFIPIRDSKVEALLGCKERVSWWQPILELYETVKEALDKFNTGHVNATNLRKLDVILWIEAQKRGI
jgi:hypothetical protein